MSEAPTAAPAPAAPATLESGTYEILRDRLQARARELQERLGQLDTARRAVFGSLGFALVGTEWVVTAHNCMPSDLVAIGGNRFLFGYNVFIGLKSQTDVADVFAAYEKHEHSFRPTALTWLADERFQADFHSLYRYYRQTQFAKFSILGPHLFMVFRVGPQISDIKTFKWLLTPDGLAYQGNRSDHEFRYPPQHEFEWTRTHRDLHRQGPHPHISIADRLFVETIGGDLTIKIEDNTATGAGIYAEPVAHRDQTLDDAEIFYAILGHLILLKIRPYQEDHYRYFVYNENLRQVRRIDTLADACVLLPNHHGIIFSNGYYLQLGECKQYPGTLTDMTFERRVASPNGEDHLYVFYNRQDGLYVLMSYNVIAQQVEAPVLCNGFSLFANGELALFKAQAEPQKHHVLQIWQTPYRTGESPLPEQQDSYLFKIGNPAIVRCMAECHELLSLLRKDDTYADLYVDLVKRADDVLNAYFWLDHPEACGLRDVLQAIHTAAAGAVDEFDKVARLRHHARSELARVSQNARALIESVQGALYEEILEYVEHLARLRAQRGELIALKEVRYVDAAQVESLEAEVADQAEALAHRCVEFLLQPDALAPYHAQAVAHRAACDGLEKVAEVKQVEAQVAQSATNLELLIEIVSNLKIEDATQTTRIVENISGVYAELNQVQARLKRRRQELQQVEGAAQFAAQMRLLDQSAVNYLEVCAAPERCDEYLNKLLVHLTELEGRFADFDAFQAPLAEKREELYAAFEGRKVALVAARSQRAQNLMTAAERILKGIAQRAQQFDALQDIHGFFAADLMVERVRELVRQLLELDDPVRAGNLQTRLKTLREEAVRQLKDRQDLFVDGRNLIQFGRHKFTVNHQPIEITLVRRDDDLFYHLTGTQFFERVEDAELLATRSVWTQELVSENPEVYRAEYLAYQLLRTLDRPGADPSLAALAEGSLEACQGQVQHFMAPRYAEGYVKGVHDLDAAQLLQALARLHRSVGLLRYSPRTRACATVFWQVHRQRDPLLAARLEGFRLRHELFAPGPAPPDTMGELQQRIEAFCQETRLFPASIAEAAAEYLFQELTSRSRSVISQPAADLVTALESHLRNRQAHEAFAAALARVAHDPASAFPVLRDLLAGYLATQTVNAPPDYLDESASLLLRRAYDPQAVVAAVVDTRLEGLLGTHPVIQNGVYHLKFHQFIEKLRRYEQDVVPAFNRCHARKTALLEQKRRALRLAEFQPHVLTAFVRNRLIGQVYLPLIGDNLAKQIGVAGEQTRTDRMGLLLLISPPGYGKTTLMEYLAHRLGITFIKINGPALGGRVTSLDPAEAPNASAREELEKANLAFEMGDNIMIYLDDIQHCHPELLQKFISLCDAQRKIEGVYRGQARTYDLRGKKVAMVMAGNPYTESGSKFQIPDMLANRADTYNLGDIVAHAADAFRASYLENALTSNPVLSPLSSRHTADLFPLLELAAGGSRENVQFEGNYSVEEINEFVAVLRILLRLRDAVLRVNQEYIRSAAQADAYRTEPPFRLQGSYRNMNRLAERVVPIMNDDEVTALLHDHYQNEAQTLASGAEANLLKFSELMGTLTAEAAQRWQDIKRTFQRNLLLQTTDAQDPVGRIAGQLATFAEGLEAIRKVLATGLSERRPPPDTAATELAALPQSLEAIRATLAEGLIRAAEPPPPPAPSPDPLLDLVQNRLADLNQALRSIQAALAASAKPTEPSPATFRLINPASKADFEITNVSQDTLNKIWSLVDEERQRRPSPDK